MDVKIYLGTDCKSYYDSVSESEIFKDLYDIKLIPFLPIKDFKDYQYYIRLEPGYGRYQVTSKHFNPSKETKLFVVVEMVNYKDPNLHMNEDEEMLTLIDFDEFEEVVRTFEGDIAPRWFEYEEENFRLISTTEYKTLCRKDGKSLYYHVVDFINGEEDEFYCTRKFSQGEDYDIESEDLSMLRRVLENIKVEEKPDRRFRIRSPKISCSNSTDEDSE